MTRRRPTSGTRRDYPRTARVGELLREIIGGDLETIDDDALAGVVVTSVDIDRDLRRAMVYFDSRFGPDVDEEIIETFEGHRGRLQASINRQAHLRRTPELVFVPDPAVRGGERIDEVLRDLATTSDDFDGRPSTSPSPDGEASG